MTQSPDDPKDFSKVSDFQRQIGVVRVEAADGRCTVWLESRTDARNPKGDVHGGALAALCDVAMARAVRSANVELWGLSTVSMTINYLEPVGGDVVAHGTLVKNGGSLAFAEVVVLNADNVPALRGTGVFRKIRVKAT
ncbi:MAG: thioesterase superfamily protein [Hyphomicrobiales bacterium]|nr:thioesterase superfamily protein [Hyphomicrobiales bacterium]